MVVMAVPHVINELIERFDRNADEYRFGGYNETQLRRDFIDPFFEALGWDVNNKLGYAESYRHVVHEDAIKIGGHTKAPDYGFYIGETRKFFVEAKNPSVNIKHDPAAAFQLRRYGWSDYRSPSSQTLTSSLSTIVARSSLLTLTRPQRRV
jgi:hypothetical protein